MSTNGPGSEGRQGEPSLLSLINGYQITQAIYVGTTLGIPDLLADGARTSEELAKVTASHPGALYRLLRALAAVGVLSESPKRSFTLTSLGNGLRSGCAGSRADWARLVGRPSTWAAWGNLLHSVRTGENAFHQLHGESVWSFRSRDSEECAIFDLAMREGSSRMVDQLLATHDFSRYKHVVDLGGGDGTLISGLLAACKEARGTLYDLPHVVNAGAKVLENAGMADRCKIIGGSFFQSVPPGGDAYVLKQVLHDWEDDEVLCILRNCRNIMEPNARLLIIERLLAPPNEGAEGKLSDLNMLAVAGGRERTADEMETILKAAGFALSSAKRMLSARYILDASPC